jgi:hypothetical protein
MDVKNCTSLCRRSAEGLVRVGAGGIKDIQKKAMAKYKSLFTSMRANPVEYD